MLQTSGKCNKPTKVHDLALLQVCPCLRRDWASKVSAKVREADTLRVEGRETREGRPVDDQAAFSAGWYQTLGN